MNMENGHALRQYRRHRSANENLLVEADPDPDWGGFIIIKHTTDGQRPHDVMGLSLTMTRKLYAELGRVLNIEKA